MEVGQRGLRQHGMSAGWWGTMMATLLGAFIRSARVGQRLALQSLAARVGYRNQNKGATRIERLERDGGAATDLLDRVTFALGLDQQTLAQLAARDESNRQATFDAWVRMPQPMELHRFVAGVTVCSVLPGYMSQAQ